MIHVYNFMPRFERPILARTKMQTIRAARADGRVPQVGDELRAFVGMRTKSCRRIAIPEARVKSVEHVEICWQWVNQIVVGHRDIKQGWINDFARDDGFADLDDMRRFFNGRNGHSIFFGYLICWRFPS